MLQESVYDFDTTNQYYHIIDTTATPKTSLAPFHSTLSLPAFLPLSRTEVTFTSTRLQTILSSDADSKTDVKNKGGGSHGSSYARYLHRATGRFTHLNCT